MRNLLILAAIGGLGYYGWQRHVAANPAPEPPGQYGYAEKRITVGLPNGRELEMVMAIESPSDKECAAAGMPGLDTPAFCSAPGFRCTNSDLRCIAAVPGRYAGMLAGQPQQNPYMYLTETATGRNGVIVAWGTTSDESRVLCAAMGKGNDKISLRCL